jgi:hypothetical protein
VNSDFLLLVSPREGAAEAKQGAWPDRGDHCQKLVTHDLYFSGV